MSYKQTLWQQYMFKPTNHDRETKLCARWMLKNKKPWTWSRGGTQHPRRVYKCLTCLAPKNICSKFHDSHLILLCPHPPKLHWPLKYFTLLAVIAPEITASHRCITSHRRSYSSQHAALTHTPWSLNSPLQNTACHFTQTQLQEQ